MASPYAGKLTPDVNILDAYGRPIVPELLTRELAFPTLTGVRNVLAEAIAPNLNPGTMAALLAGAAQGDHLAYLALAEEMEEKDLHYAAQLGTRKRAVVRLPIDIDAAGESAQEKKIADAVRELCDGDNFRALLEELLDALGKGYSVAEICWDRTKRLWTPEEYKWRDPRFFQFDRATLSRIRLRDEENLVDGMPLAPYKFLVHYPRLKTGIPLRGGLARLVAWSYLFKNYTLKDWVSFVEIFGMPLRLGRYDANSVTEKDKSVLRQAVANIGSDAAAILPKSMEIEFQEAAKATGGERLYEGLATYLDKQVSKAILGQTMTADDGSSKSQAQVHDEVRGDIRDADALQLAATINRDLIRAFVDLNFGPQPDYPKFKFVIEEPEDLVEKSERDGNLAKNAGVRFSTAYFEREYGFQPGDIVAVGPAEPSDQSEESDKSAPKAAMQEAMNRALNSEGAEAFPDQVAVDALMQSLGADTPMLQEMMRPLVAPIFALVKEGEDLNLVREKLIGTFPAMNGAALEEVLARIIFITEAWGRINGNEN